MSNDDTVVKLKQPSNALNKNNNIYTKCIIIVLIFTFLLAPLQGIITSYINKKAIEKDNESMTKIIDTLQSSLSNASVWNELSICMVERNYSCYADGNPDTNVKKNKVVGDSIDSWTFNDNCRKLDNVRYQPTGLMSGITITFTPNDYGEYVISSGAINHIDKHTKNSEFNSYVGEHPNLNQLLENAVGKTIPIHSPAHKNSNYTVFINWGINVTIYGQYNGTNLSRIAEVEDSKASIKYITITQQPAEDKNEKDEEVEEEIVDIVEGVKNIKQISWDGFQYVIGQDIWSHNGTYYYSYPEDGVCYVLKDNTWEPCTNEHPDVFYGQCVWSDGQNTYLSVGKDNYVFDGKTWKPSPWSNDAEIYGNHIWSHNNKIYMSVMLQDPEDQHKFIFKHYLYKNNQWEEFKWNGFNNVSGNHIWSDGTNTYYSCEDDQYVLKDNAWVSKTWKGVSDIVGINVWTDGTNIFYSYGDEQYILQGNAWKKIVWKDELSFYGVNVWKYGDSYCVSDMGTYMFTE